MPFQWIALHCFYFIFLLSFYVPHSYIIICKLHWLNTFLLSDISSFLYFNNWGYLTKQLHVILISSKFFILILCQVLFILFLSTVTLSSVIYFNLQPGLQFFSDAIPWPPFCNQLCPFCSISSILVTWPAHFHFLLLTTFLTTSTLFLCLISH